MSLVLENRASFILYNVIRSNKLHKGVMLLPANICPIVPATLFKTGTHFEFVDIQSDNFLLDCDSILHKIKQSENINSVLVHSTFGFEYDFEGFLSELRSINRDIFIINDRCLNIPSVTPGKTSADVVLYSTGYSKYVDFSFGGFAFIADKVSYDRNTIRFNTNDHDNLVSSFERSLSERTQFNNPDTDWLDGSHLILKKSEYFNNIVKRVRTIADQKKKINNIYYKNLKNGIVLGEGYNSWRFNILVNNKKEVLEKIFESGLFASSHYQSLAGLFGNGEGVNAEKLHSKVINLFNDFRFTSEQAYSVTKIINRYAK